MKEYSVYCVWIQWSACGYPGPRCTLNVEKYVWYHGTFKFDRMSFQRAGAVSIKSMTIERDKLIYLIFHNAGGGRRVEEGVVEPAIFPSSFYRKQIYRCLYQIMQDILEMNQPFSLVSTIMLFDYVRPQNRMFVSNTIVFVTNK